MHSTAIISGVESSNAEEFSQPKGVALKNGRRKSVSESDSDQEYNETSLTGESAHFENFGQRRASYQSTTSLDRKEAKRLGK